MLKRNTNENVLYYVANLTKQGKFDPYEPISAYWIMAAEDGHKEELTWYEKEHVYGFSIHRDSTGQSIILKIKAMDKLPVRVVVVAATARAEIEIAGKMAYLDRIFVKVNHGLFPGVDSINIIGSDVTTGREIQEIIRP